MSRFFVYSRLLALAHFDPIRSSRPESCDRKHRRSWRWLRINFIVALIRPFNCPSRAPALADGNRERRTTTRRSSINGERQRWGTENK